MQITLSFDAQTGGDLRNQIASLFGLSTGGGGGGGGNQGEPDQTLIWSVVSACVKAALGTDPTQEQVKAAFDTLMWTLKDYNATPSWYDYGANPDPRQK